MSTSLVEQRNFFSNISDKVLKVWHLLPVKSMQGSWSKLSTVLTAQLRLDLVLLITSAFHL